MTAPTLNADEIEEAAELYQLDRWSTPRIADWFGCSCSAVRRALRVAGVQMRRCGYPAAVLGDDIGTDTDEAIGRRHGVHASTVWLHRKRAGVPAFKGGEG